MESSVIWTFSSLVKTVWSFFFKSTDFLCWWSKRGHNTGKIKSCLYEIIVLILISDNRILEYKFDTVLFNKQSEFQQIQIVETQDFGRLLILNEYANLAENDRVEYTHTLMNLPHENYSVNFFYKLCSIFYSPFFPSILQFFRDNNVYDALNFHAKIEI